MFCCKLPSFTPPQPVRTSLSLPTLPEFTNSLQTGERRIRVITSALPVTSNIYALYSSADPIAITTLFANKAIERTMSSKLEYARESLDKDLRDILVAYKTNVTAGGGSGGGQLAISENLGVLPLLCVALQKHVSDFAVYMCIDVVLMLVYLRCRLLFGRVFRYRVT